MSELAVLLQRPGPVSLVRQAAVCMAYLEEHGYRLVGFAPTDEDAAALAASGQASVVVAAYAGPTDRRLRGLLRPIGARLEYCREQPPSGDDNPDTRSLIIGLANRGSPPGRIAEILRVPLVRVLKELE